ncbi:hypothetical protein C8R41DRAFT_867315 [Lentinula lateritia]|uniref:Uncharacterized protein n=1 Tax=Lentinula lateritia TaxID=40482 RepID=A0ABQ8VFQ8_9AGAR|nr:hypothetical protein C8R41DRAFT_867315 [Lentinula lateritia]
MLLTIAGHSCAAARDDTISQSVISRSFIHSAGFSNWRKDSVLATFNFGFSNFAYTSPHNFVVLDDLPDYDAVFGSQVEFWDNAAVKILFLRTSSVKWLCLQWNSLPRCPEKLCEEIVDNCKYLWQLQHLSLVPFSSVDKQFLVKLKAGIIGIFQRVGGFEQ